MLEFWGHLVLALTEIAASVMAVEKLRRRCILFIMAQYILFKVK